MVKEKIKAYKLDEFTHEITLLDIKNDIDTYLKLIQCDMLDFATFADLGDYRIVAVVDDNGIFYNRAPVCLYASGIGVLYGTVLFVRHYYDSEDFTDIEEEDLKLIQLCLI